MKLTEMAQPAVDQALDAASNVSSTTGLGATAAHYLAPAASGLKKIAGKIIPGANMAYQAADAAKRAARGDVAGAAISGASIHPAASIPGTAVQAIKDKIQTGSWFPSDEELDAYMAKQKANPPAGTAAAIRAGKGTPPVREVLNPSLSFETQNMREMIASVQDELDETRKLTAQEKFLRSLKRAGYDPDAAARRILALIDRQKREREEFEKQHPSVSDNDQAVQEANVGPDELVDVYISGRHRGRPIRIAVAKNFPNKNVSALTRHLDKKYGVNPNTIISGPRAKKVAEVKDSTPGKISKSEDPCWSGYHMVGTKKKGNRTVPNCVPGSKGSDK